MTHTRAQGEACSVGEAPRWRVLLDRANAGPRCGARCKRTGLSCRGAAMPNGRCRMHGGSSTGARTAAGLERCRVSSWKHGGRDAAARARARQRGMVRKLTTDLHQMIAELRSLDQKPVV